MDSISDLAVYHGVDVGGPRQNGGMNNIAAALAKVGDDLVGVVGELFAGDAARSMSETEIAGGDGRRGASPARG